MPVKSISEITSIINRSLVVGQSFMFRKHLERKQLKSRECLCILGGGGEKEESRCFLLRPKAEDKEISPHSVSSLQSIKMKAKDRKYSLKPNLKENENSSNLNSENFMANLESIRYRLNILQNKQKTPVSFTYQNKTTLQILGEISQKQADYSDKKEKKTWETESSTVASLIFPPNGVKTGTKVSIMYLKKRLITQNSADTDLPLQESESKTFKTRTFSSSSLDRQKTFKFNPNFPQFKFINAKNQNQENRPTDREFLKLNELCFKKAESVGESECSSEHVSEVQNSFSSPDQEAFQGNWNTSLKDLFQKRQQKMNPQFY